MTFGCFAGFAGFDCSILWIVMVLLFFAAAIFRKNIAEGIGIDFSLMGATALGIITFIIITYITHSIKWSGIIGLVGMIIGGVIGSKFLPDGEGDSGGGDGWF